MVIGGIEAVIVEGVGAANEYGTFHQLDGDVGLHVDTASKVTTHPETQSATTLFRNPVDGELDTAGVHSHTVAADAEFGGVVDGLLAVCNGLTDA